MGGLKPSAFQWWGKCSTTVLQLLSKQKYYQEVFVRDKAQYHWPPCANWFISAPSCTENSIYLFYKTSYLNEEVNCTEPSTSVSIPCNTPFFQDFCWKTRNRLFPTVFVGTFSGSFTRRPTPICSTAPAISASARCAASTPCWPTTSP